VTSLIAFHNPGGEGSAGARETSRSYIISPYFMGWESVWFFGGVGAGYGAQIRFTNKIPISGDE